MHGREDVLLGLAVVFGSYVVDIIWIVRLWVIEPHDALSSAIEAPCDNVQMVYLVASKQKCQPHVPVSLLASPKYCHVVYRVSFLQHHGGSQSSPERCDLLGIEKTCCVPSIVHKR